jgi:large subunit ribosomal protein L21
MGMTDTTTLETDTTPETAPAPAPVAASESTAYAIVETGGKQYRVKVGDRISVERLAVEGGNAVTFDRVLLVGGDGGTRVGAPVVDGATVTANVDDHFRGEKIVVFKYKPKKRYRKRIGHRQELTHLTITAINA